VLLSKHHAADALLSLQGIKINPPFLQYPLLYKMWGDAYVFRCDFVKAEKNYLTFLQFYKGKHYLKDTYYKLHLGRCMQRDTAKAMHYLMQLKSKGHSVFESDKRAEHFARQHHFLNPFLLKSRLFFDGGYYNEALETLQQFKWDARTPLIWRVEYAYRNGRILHVLGKKNEAINYYQQALKWNGRADISYFAPSAALHLALLHEEKKDFLSAKKYFKQAQQFKNHEYRNSISYKAKLGLKRVQ
jgi:tetratricopeptide (TPR) repeat protein